MKCRYETRCRQDHVRSRCQSDRHSERNVHASARCKEDSRGLSEPQRQRALSGAEHRSSYCIREVANRPTQPTARASRHQSHLDSAHGPAAGTDRLRLRSQRDAADASRATRLARCRADRKRLEHETHPSADRDVGGVSVEFFSPNGERRGGETWS